MSKVFRPWDVEQTWLLPPSVQELVPAEHAAHFVRNLVRDELDLGAVYEAYEEERGFPPYHPAMMTALLLYGYTQGVFSSRKSARRRPLSKRKPGKLRPPSTTARTASRQAPPRRRIMPTGRPRTRRSATSPTPTVVS